MKSAFLGSRVFCIGLLVSGLIASCATSPLGRKQLILLPDNQMNSLGSQSFQELKAKTPVERDPRINAYVQCIAQGILRAMSDGGQVDARNWEVIVFRDATPNAFALPGGKIGVHTGILPVAKTPDQLAAVMGHEVGHVIARHGNERVSQGQVAAIVMGVSQVALKDMKQQEKALIIAGLGAGVQFGALLPFSRSHESEADLIGLDLMAKAGFNPEESVELWKNMSASAGGSPPEWMSTHPSSDTRIANLKSRIPSVMPAYQSALDARGRPTCHL
jgi:predicted Zn-dependent protease